MSLAKDRDTPTRAGTEFVDPVAANVKIHAGGIVLLNAAGDAIPGQGGNAFHVRGIAQEAVDNTGGLAGAKTVKTRRGQVWRFKNSAGDDLITRADIGKTCYVVDDEAVSKTNNPDGATRTAAGVVRDVEAAGVWVEI